MSEEERNRKIADQIYDLVKAMQEIKFICERAKSFYVEEKDIDEILEIIKQRRI